MFTSLIDEQSPNLNLNEFKPTLESEVEITSHLEILSEQLDTFKQGILDKIYILESQLDSFDKNYSQSRFIAEKIAAVAAQDDLNQTFISQGIEGSKQYESLIDTKLSLEKSIESLNKVEKRIQEINSQIQNSYQSIVDIRVELTENRIKFLDRYINGNDTIQIQILPLCDRYHLDSTFRDIIGKTDNTFVSDIYDSGKKSGLLYDLNKDLEAMGKTNTSSINDIFAVLDSLKISLATNSLNEAFDLGLSKRFKDLLSNLNPSIKDSIQTWFPEDNLTIKFHDGRRFKDVAHGSAGQKASAILSFLLSYGSEPLILDQPEDDLDNGPISSLIVSKLHESKKERQIIIVTHNPNIVVNGDSEYVVALEEKGQININASGALQEVNVRKNVCEIMEGGEIALQKRYNRMFNI